MLRACERFGLSDVGLTLRFAVERDAGVYYAKLEGASWHTGLLPQAPNPPGDWVFLCLIRAGRVWVAPDGFWLESGVPFVVTEQHIVAADPDGSCFRSEMPVLEGVALRVRAADTRLDASRPKNVTVDASVRQALENAVDVLAGDADTGETQSLFQRLLDACADTGILTRHLRVEAERRRHSALERARKALFPILETLFQSPMLVDAMSRVGTTDRQVRRDILRLQREYGFFDRGWRNALNRWRITAAVLLLSSDSLSNAEVAVAVGYGSLTAMDRAFKRAGLPTPRQVREQHQQSFP
ncbi:MAG: helix-turn-helix transcriptional regulator [Polyangiaceae bacterium]|nr:helix-turn-helix transcriptional regulator [Polyangiaceae bacterium]